jgi:hypothetical protein
MTIRTLLLTATVCASAASMTAFAHPGAHDEEKPIPTTCAQLADTERYTDDVSYPEVKALKARCETEGKRVPQPRPERDAAPRTSDKTG